MQPCSVKGCERTDKIRRGMCDLHYKRWWKHGSTHRRPPTRRPILSRFMEKVEPLGHDGCWLWVGALRPNGYGQMSNPDYRLPPLKAHRVAYELFVGPIPEGLHIDHSCNVRACVNPAHLEAVTQAENNRRMGERRRAKA